MYAMVSTIVISSSSSTNLDENWSRKNSCHNQPFSAPACDKKIRLPTKKCAARGCQIFLGPMYQIEEKYTK
jgi:hypothetical protein